MTNQTGHAWTEGETERDKERVGPFELERLLGRGGMAETFVALRRGPAGFEQRVCLKRIRPELATDPKMVELFHAEARNTAILRHSNIVQVIDYGSEGEHHYLALELVDGVDLHRLLDKQPQGRLPAEVVTYIAVELSAALEHAHNAPNQAGQHGVFHRDISPANVLVSVTGDLKLTDFGVAKAQGDARSTAVGIVRGKVEYMAPEYGMGGPYDARCDQFSLGVMLFELLTGARPYQGDSQGEILHRAHRGFHKALAPMCPDAPPALIEIVDRMLFPRGEQRFESMTEVTKALIEVAPGPRVRGHLGQLAVAARDGSVPPPPLRQAPSEEAFANTIIGETHLGAPTGAPSSPSPVATVTSDNARLDTAALLEGAGVRPRSRKLLGWIALALLLLAVLGVVLVRGDKVEQSVTPVSVSDVPPEPTIASEPTGATGVEDELPVGVEPPSDDPADTPSSNTAPGNTTPGNTAGPRLRPATSREPDPEPERTPDALIHRQKHDLLKPKGW